MRIISAPSIYIYIFTIQILTIQSVRWVHAGCVLGVHWVCDQRTAKVRTNLLECPAPPSAVDMSETLRGNKFVAYFDQGHDGNMLLADSPPSKMC
jgi:hypothetical protein